MSKVKFIFFLYFLSISVNYVIILILKYLSKDPYYDFNFDGSDRDAVIKYKEFIFRDAIEKEKGKGCQYPMINPFHEELSKEDRYYGKIKCKPYIFDWVDCNLHKCRIKPEVFMKYTNLSCSFYWIKFVNDFKSVEIKDKRTWSANDTVIYFNESDHAKVTCEGNNVYSGNVDNWIGYVTGFRSNVSLEPTPPQRENTPNIMILAFDSTSYSAFVRKMKKSLKILKRKLNATILRSYNVAGDGTAANMFPFFTGRNDLELPESRNFLRNFETSPLDEFPFIFFQLRQDGYRTAYFEDTPSLGTFQYRHSGFNRQPTHHYIRPLLVKEGRTRYLRKMKSFCFGEKPQYLMLLNLTEQVHSLGGKIFSFTFISDISHDNNNLISSSDEDVSEFLERMSKYLHNTMLIVMGDHGPRYKSARANIFGKYDERHPFMAIVLPNEYVAKRPNSLDALKNNSKVLTTPYDIHATLLDFVGLSNLSNTYIVPGASTKRGLSLFNMIPKNRSCSEAGIEPHWCPCAQWKIIYPSDPNYQTIVGIFVVYINNVTKSYGHLCAERQLLNVSYVQVQYFNEPFLKFGTTLNSWLGIFRDETQVPFKIYQIKAILTPKAIFEATIMYSENTDMTGFHIDPRDTSRLDWYANESKCMTNPYLAKYCYCR